MTRAPTALVLHLQKVQISFFRDLPTILLLRRVSSPSAAPCEPRGCGSGVVVKKKVFLCEYLKAFVSYAVAHGHQHVNLKL